MYGRNDFNYYWKRKGKGKSIKEKVARIKKGII